MTLYSWCLTNIKENFADGGALIMMSHMGKPKGKS